MLLKNFLANKQYFELLADFTLHYGMVLMALGYLVTPLLMRPLWCVYMCLHVCVNESVSVYVGGWHWADLNNNVLRVDCTRRKGMNSNVKRLTFIHYGWHWHHMMSKTGGLWDHVTSYKRSNRKQRSASRKKKRFLSFPMAAHWNIHQCLEWCAKLCCWLPAPQDVEKHRHACHGNGTASLRYT